MDVESVLHCFNAKHIVLDTHDSYVKQTYRSRCYIAAANGKLTLNIPIIHDGSGTSSLYRDIQIDHSQPWASNHLKSIMSAYKSSPYFEYYQDGFETLYSSIPDGLMEWNIKTMFWLLNQLEIKPSTSESASYTGDELSTYLITAKKKTSRPLEPYMQVFQEKHGFLQPLSGLDLLFNLGPSARAYLKNSIV